MNIRNNALKRIEYQSSLASNEALLKNLQNLMEKEGISKAELARRTGIPQPTVHKILAGKTEDPRISTLQAFAAYFGVSVDKLFSESPMSAGKEKTFLNIKSIPIISWEDCTKSSTLTEHLTAENHSQWLIVEHINGDHAYALASRPSMEPRFPRGTVFVVNPQLAPIDGDLVIVQYANTTEATLRELSIDGPNKLMLHPGRSGEYDKWDETIKVLGTVIQSRFSYQS